MTGRVEIDEEGMAAFETSIVDACDAVIVSVKTEVEDRAPVRTGNLRGNVNSSGDAHTGYRITADADYSAYVERGTDKFPAEPFMRPSIHTEREITQ